MDAANSVAYLDLSLSAILTSSGRDLGSATDVLEENSPSIRHQNQAVFELFSGLSRAEKLDEERVLGV